MRSDRPAELYVSFVKIGACMCVIGRLAGCTQVMSVWPFSSMILRSSLKTAELPDASPALQPRHLFHFGVADAFKKELGLVNQLTG